AAYDGVLEAAKAAARSHEWRRVVAIRVYDSIRPQRGRLFDNAAAGAGSANGSVRTLEWTRYRLIAPVGLSSTRTSPILVAPRHTCGRRPDTIAPFGAGRMITVGSISKRYA